MIPTTLPKSDTLRSLQYIIYCSVILYVARNILIPISFALLISFILYPLSAKLEKKGLPRIISVIIPLLGLVLLGIGLLALLAYQLIQFSAEWPSISSRFDEAVSEISKLLSTVFGVSKESQNRIVSSIGDLSAKDLIGFLSASISGSVLSAGLFILIPVYSVFILMYRSYWVKILFRIFPGEEQRQLVTILSETIDTYYNFIKGMAIVYLVVGALNSIGLLVLGIPHAILFGFIASILTFIPYLGIIAGSLLPVTMAWLTYDSIWYPLGVIGVFSLVQYLEANVIFPIAVGNRLKVNTLAILVSIFAGEILWGMSGMILFIPFIGIIKLIADRKPEWLTISMILGTEKK